jgi:hypothetical protein
LKACLNQQHHHFPYQQHQVDSIGVHSTIELFYRLDSARQKHPQRRHRSQERVRSVLPLSTSSNNMPSSRERPQSATRTDRTGATLSPLPKTDRTSIADHRVNRLHLYSTTADRKPGQLTKIDPILISNPIEMNNPTNIHVGNLKVAFT